MSNLHWLRILLPTRDSTRDTAHHFPPVAILHTPGSVLARPRTAAEFPYFVGQRPRLATCGGVAWFHGFHLATLNLLDNAIHTYRFDPRIRAFLPLQTLAGLCGLARPENFAFSPAGDLLAVTNSVGGTVIIYSVDAETHAINTTPVGAIKCGDHIAPHGVSFSPCASVLLFSTAEHPGSVRCSRIVRGIGGAIETQPMQEVVNKFSPLRPKGVAFSPDGRFVAISYGCNAQTKAHQDRAGFLAVHAFDSRTGCSPNPVSISGGDLALRCAEDVNFLPDSSHMVVTDQANDEGIAVAFDSNTGAIGRKKITIRNPRAQLSFPHGNAVSPDGRYLAIANYGDDKVTVYELDLR